MENNPEPHRGFPSAWNRQQLVFWWVLIFRSISFLRVRVNLVWEAVTKEKTWCYLFACMSFVDLCSRNSCAAHMGTRGFAWDSPRAASQRACLGKEAGDRDEIFCSEHSDSSELQLLLKSTAELLRTKHFVCSGKKSMSESKIVHT